MLPDEDAVIDHAKLLLQEAEVGHKLPTPVDDLVACAGLVVSGDAALDEDHADFFAARAEYANALSASSYGRLKSALRKAWGLIDLQDNIIYIDQTVSQHKQAFLKLHEVAHKMLPWQRHTYFYLDDKTTLRPDVKKLYERQANYFASVALFQADRFTRHSRDLPLELKTPLELSRMYGASPHATIRRYVEVSQRCCSLFVMEPSSSQAGEPVFRVAYMVQSNTFAQQFEGLAWSSCLGAGSRLTQALQTGRRYVEGDGLVLADRYGRGTECSFHVLRNSYNAFAFVFPLSESLRKSRTRIRKRTKRL